MRSRVRAAVLSLFAIAASGAAWQPGIPGVEWGELRIQGAREAWRTRLVITRVDPRQIDLSLVPAFADRQGWNIGRVEGDVAVALDAGQFRGSLPFGWVE